MVQRKISFADLAEGHRAKYGFLPVRQVLNTAKKRLSDAWAQRLAHQIQELPELEQVIGEVLDVYDSWAAARETAGELR